jgi:2-haloacid dehalogenase
MIRGTENHVLCTVNAEIAKPSLESPASARRYQWLLFDADDTVFDFERAESAALRQVFRQMRISFDPGYLAVYRRINQALWQAVEKGELTRGILKVRRFELFLEAVAATYSPHEFSAQYLGCLATRTELVEDACNVLGNLCEKYRLAILTNGLKEVQRGRLTLSPIRHYISEIIISDEIGFAKPAKEFFDVTFDRLGHPPRCEVLMIGDGWTSDIEGAVQYGIDACWYNPARKPRPAQPKITHEIASLRELSDWLG